MKEANNALVEVNRAWTERKRPKFVMRALASSDRKSFGVWIGLTACSLVWSIGSVTARADGELAASPQFNEQIATRAVDPGIRIHVNAPAAQDDVDARPTRVIVFALPNGNTLEQTLGCKLAEGMDWHYDIQHIAAQVRLLRNLLPQQRIVLVCAEAKGLSWPAWRAGHKEANKLIADLVERWRVEYGGPDAKVTLTGHSGGGGFDFSVVEAHEEIPATIDRIVFLDSNYNFNAAQHEAKFTNWLAGDDDRRLIVLAYDDREIVLNEKKVVGPTGGTYRATDRMVQSLGPEFNMRKTESAPWIEWAGVGGRIHFYVHTNPENKILHTALVGDMNGLVHAQTLGTPAEGTWGKFGGPRAYVEFIQEEPTAAVVGGVGSEEASVGTPLVAAEPLEAPPRRADAPTGSAFAEQVESLDLDAREAAIFAEIQRGNFPEFQRKFWQVPIQSELPDGRQLVGMLEVMPDYLAVGGDADFLRMPMRPQTAHRIAALFGCVIPTRKMVDAIDAAATVRFTPAPLTEDRELVAAFVLANSKTEAQRTDKQPLGELSCGAKKDIVLTPRIFERPERLAIYGWRHPDGSVIQPLTIVHWDRYVDYSHGVRLVRDTVVVDGKRVPIKELLVDPGRCALVSDEGVIDPPRYPDDK
jgi:hypothetical protein